MTLKSLNTRYAKLIRKMTVMSIGLLAAVSLLGLTGLCAGATGFNRHTAEADKSIPALQDSIVASLFVNEQQLTASDGVFGDGFGHSVAFSGSTVFVSAIGDNFGHGAVYVFKRQGGSWVEEQKLTASDGASGDGFGQSVGISGSTLVAGSPGDDIFKGSIYLFKRQGGNWIEEQKLTASDGAPVDFFGFSAAISGSTIVVGSIGEDLGSHFDQGSVYVFNRQGGSWVEEQKLTASDAGPGDFFGWSVAVSDSTIVVGVPFETISGSNTPGSAYVFNRQGADWVVTQKLTPSNGEADDFFSFSVAVSGSTVVVGAENSGNIGQGSVYIFKP